MQQVTELLTANNISFEVYVEDWPQDFDEHTDIFLVGGDGTLNYFINKYPHNTRPLSIFKGGSGNDFCWKLYGNLSVKEYFERIMYCQPRKVDAGICNGNYFANGVGIGFDGAIVKGMKQRRLFSAGHVAYYIAVIRSLLFYLEKRMEIFLAGHVIEGRFFMISIANGERYGGGFIVAPGAEINDGKLDVVTIERIDPIRRMIHLPKLSSGTHMLLPVVKKYQCGEVEVRSEKLLTAHFDGELLESRKIMVRILPGHLWIRY